MPEKTTLATSMTTKTTLHTRQSHVMSDPDMKMDIPKGPVARLAGGLVLRQRRHHSRNWGDGVGGHWDVRVRLERLDRVNDHDGGRCGSFHCNRGGTVTAVGVVEGRRGDYEVEGRGVGSKDAERGRCHGKHARPRSSSHMHAASPPLSQPPSRLLLPVTSPGACAQAGAFSTCTARIGCHRTLPSVARRSKVSRFVASMPCSVHSCRLEGKVRTHSCSGDLTTTTVHDRNDFHINHHPHSKTSQTTPAQSIRP